MKRIMNKLSRGYNKLPTSLLYKRVRIHNLSNNFGFSLTATAAEGKMATCDYTSLTRHILSTNLNISYNIVFNTNK